MQKLMQYQLVSAEPPKADITTGSRYAQRSSSGSFATFAAIRRASSRVSSLAADRRPGSHIIGLSMQQSSLIKQPYRALSLVQDDVLL